MMNTLLPEVSFAASFMVHVRDQSRPDTAGVARALAGALKARLARNIALSGDHVSFEGPGQFAVAPWSLLTPVDRGELKLAAIPGALRIEYRLVYTRHTVLSSIVALLGAGVVAVSSEWPVGVVAFVFFELVVCVANLSFSLGRVRDFCQRIVWDTLNRADTGRLTSA